MRSFRLKLARSGLIVAVVSVAMAGCGPDDGGSQPFSPLAPPQPDGVLAASPTLPGSTIVVVGSLLPDPEVEQVELVIDDGVTSVTLLPAIRDPDGLAISSRNRYLTPEERKRAPLLHATLREVQQKLAAGERDYGALERAAVARLAAAGFRPDYVEVRSIADLGRPNGRHAPGELIVLAAAWLGRARLIDNLRVAA